MAEDSGNNNNNNTLIDEDELIIKDELDNDCFEEVDRIGGFEEVDRIGEIEKDVRPATLSLLLIAYKLQLPVF